MDDLDQQIVADALKGSWVHRFLPSSLWPYAQLARWERPIGWQLLMWPCWWSVMLAANFYLSRDIDQSVPYFDANTQLLEILKILGLFTAGAFIMRGAGCTFNDIVDRDIDDQVARTRSRPLPSGRISSRNAWLFLALQLGIGLFILLQFNWPTILLGISSLVLVIIYPFMKRITWWPQLFLGLAFSWGALVGWSAILGGLFSNLSRAATLELFIPALLLYIGCIFWTIGYDTIYAHQDRADDALVGVKSTARLFGETSKKAITVLYGLTVIFWAIGLFLAFPKIGLIAIPAVIGLVLASAHLIWQINKLDINDPDLCLRLFKSNNHLGLIFFSGLAVSALLNLFA